MIQAAAITGTAPHRSPPEGQGEMTPRVSRLIRAHPHAPGTPTDPDVTSMLQRELLQIICRPAQWRSSEQRAGTDSQTHQEGAGGLRPVSVGHPQRERPVVLPGGLAA